jgi:hypothetical protein
MVFINEFLPNPIGKDTEGEWVELFNNTQGTINLAGWQIKDASGKTFAFKNQQIGPSGYLVVNYKTTKIALNNNGETLFLYDQKGNLVDKAEYAGTAPEGKSLARQDKQFIFVAEPTPGKANIFKENASLQSMVSKKNLTADINVNISGKNPPH